MSKSSNIPKTLKNLPQWVIWREEERKNGKFTKVPYDPKEEGVKYARTNDAETWGTYEEAVRCVATHGADGIGFVLTNNDDIVGIDLDHCVNPKTGEIEDWALKDAKAINSYTEYSPSGEGLRIFARGTLPPGRRKTGNFEIYSNVHYLTVTGNHVPNTSLIIEKRQQEINDIHFKYFPTTNQKPKEDVDKEPTSHSDGLESYQKTEQTNDKTILDTDEIIRRALKAKNGEKFRLLMEGGLADYKSDSEADLAFCRLLAFWFAKDRQAIDKAVRESKRYRSKWDERRGGKTYGQLTIEKAVTATKSVYTSPKGTLFDLVNDIELFHDTSMQAWVTYSKDDHFETAEINSNSFINWLNHKHFKAFGSPAKQGEIDKLLDILEARAQFESPKCQLHVRLAKHKSKVYLDLCNKKWEVVVISKKGWKIIGTEKCPVKFRRTAGMLKLPRPKKKGNLKHVKKMFNLPNKSAFILLVAWLIGALNPEGPYPILLVTGQHGSAKSSLVRFIRNMIDPSQAPTKAFPRNELDMIISAKNSLIMAFDNITTINWWRSDAMCRLATGGGFSTRKLYEDDVEMVFNACRPIIFNGIEPIMSGHDLIDRCIVIELMPVSEKNRKTERTLEKDFKKMHPKLLGELCDAVSEGLKNLKNTNLKRLPRMADFATWVVAAEPALPWKQGQFLKTYMRNIDEAALKSLGADEIAIAVTDMIESENRWKGTATELLSELEGYVLQKTLKSKIWPKTASELSRRIKMAAPFLKAQGIKITFKRTSYARLIKIRKVKKKKIK